jgi:hypothetical protein
MAHEIGHQLEEDNFEYDDSTALWLSEGFASWVSSDYWFGGQTPKAFVNANYPGERFDIASGSSGDDHSYNHWAAIVDFIYETRGRDALFKLYNSASGGSGVQYEAVLNVSLEQLQEEYYEWLKKP